MDLDSLEQRYKSWKLLLDSGEISQDELARRLETQIALDRQGREWRINPDGGGWLRRDGENWVADTPGAAPTAVALKARAVESTQAATPPSQSSPVRSQPDGGRWMREHWGWLLVAGMAVVLVGVIVIVIQLVVGTEPASDRPGQGGSGKPTPVPVDLNAPPTATPSPTPIPDSQITDGGHQMILIPAGSFRMGSTEEDIEAYYRLCQTLFDRAECQQQGFEAELPAHDVTLDSYYIDQFEVTNAQFATFLNELNNQTEAGVSWYEAEDEDARIALSAGMWATLPPYEDHPATEVTWYGAKAFCEWRGARLPTEAEWEKAARWDPETGEVFRYPWGNQPPDSTRANFFDLIGGTDPVGSHESGVSPSGVHDMAGNVFEWVFDWFDSTYYQSSDMDRNPQGPANGDKKVLKGGAWVDYAFLLHSANRGSLSPRGGFNFIGFRCARNVGE